MQGDTPCGLLPGRGPACLTASTQGPEALQPAEEHAHTYPVRGLLFLISKNWVPV